MNYYYFPGHRDIKEMKQHLSCEFENILTSIFDLLLDVSPMGEIKAANKAKREVLCELEHPLVGKNLDGALPPLLSRACLLALEEAQKENILNAEALPHLVNEDQKWFEVYSYKKIPCQSNLSLFIVAIRDITVQKRDHELLKESEAHFRLMFEKTADALLLLDPETGMFTHCNQATLDMLNIKNSSLSLPLNPAELSPLYQPDGSLSVNKAKDHIDIALEKGSHRFEWIHRGPHRADFPVEVLLTPLHVKERLLILTTWRDITEQKKAMEELVKANALKSQFLNIAAHELRTPVTAFSLLLQVTRKQQEKGQSVSAEVMDRLIRQSSRISNLVNDLLEVSRLEGENLRLNKELNNLNSVINESIADFTLQYPDVRINLTNAVPLTSITIDPMRIHQVIINLLDNALKYAPSEKELEISVHSQQNCVVVKVTDHGHGISEEIMENIFKPFTRGNSDLVVSTSGLGLGLYICKKIIELHDGKIGVLSGPGKGSTFYFELPLSSP